MNPVTWPNLYADRGGRRLALAAAALLLVPLALAQYQVNRQISAPGAAQSAGSVRYASPYGRPTGYTNSAYTARIDQSAAAVLPSEARMAAKRSGALPSELKANYNRMGPMSPTGALSYIPPPVSFYNNNPRTVTQGNYVNTSVGPGGAAAMSRAPSAPGRAPGQAPANSFRTGANVASPGVAPLPTLQGPNVSQSQNLSYGSSLYGGAAPYTPPTGVGSVRYSNPSPSVSSSSLNPSSMFQSPSAASPNVGSVRYSAK